MELDSEFLESVEKGLKYSFVNKSLLKEALTHTNHASFGRLQILGQDVLKLAFTTHIYLAYPNLQPLHLDPLRTTNLSLHKLARISLNLDLHKLLPIGNNNDTKLIKLFSESFVKDDPLPYRGFLKPPRILADLFASLAGAVYTDLNYNSVHRLWEILRGLFEPLYTLDDLHHQPQLLATLFRAADQSGNRLTFRFSQGESTSTSALVFLDDKCIARGAFKGNRGHAMVAVAKYALQALSQTMPVEMVMGDKTVSMQITDAINDLINNSPHLINRIEEGGDVGKELVGSANSKRNKKRKRGSSCQGTKNENIAENTSADLQTMPIQMVMDEKSLGIETEDAKEKFIEKLPKPTNSFEEGGDCRKGFVCSATMKTPTEETVMDEDSVVIIIEGAKEKLTGICNKRKSPNPTNSVVEGGGSGKGLVCSATVEPPPEVVMDEDSLDAKTEDAKEKLMERSLNPTNSVEEGGDAEEKLTEICNKGKSPNPTNSVEEGGDSGKGLVLSGNKIEIPTEEGTPKTRKRKSKEQKTPQSSS